MRSALGIPRQLCSLEALASRRKSGWSPPQSQGLHTREGLSLDGLESLGKEGKERSSFIHELDKDGLSTYYVLLNMPSAQHALFHSFNEQLLRR